MVSSCGHGFHEACLFRWMIKSPRQLRRLSHYVGNLVPLNGTCPDCRSAIAPVFDMTNCGLAKRPRSFFEWLVCAPRVTARKWIIPAR